ncbi:hypothetical protein MASR1M59_08890 [Melaminivora sp.]
MVGAAHACQAGGDGHHQAIGHCAALFLGFMDGEVHPEAGAASAAAQAGVWCWWVHHAVTPQGKAAQAKNIKAHKT